MASAPLLLANHREVAVETEGEVNMGSKSSPQVYRDMRSPYLTVGRKFLAYQSSTDDSWIHLTDGRRYICSVPRLDAIGMADREALRLASAEKHGQLKRILKGVQRLDIDAPQRLADTEHNLSLAAKQYEGCTLLIPGAKDVAPAASTGLVEAEATIVQEKSRQAAAARRIASARGGLDAIFGDSRPVEAESDGGQDEAAEQLIHLL
jgi:hypothetical protein